MLPEARKQSCIRLHVFFASVHVVSVRTQWKITTERQAGSAPIIFVLSVIPMVFGELVLSHQTHPCMALCHSHHFHPSVLRSLRSFHLYMSDCSFFVWSCALFIIPQSWLPVSPLVARTNRMELPVLMTKPHKANERRLMCVERCGVTCLVRWLSELLRRRANVTAMFKFSMRHAAAAARSFAPRLPDTTSRSLQRANVNL